MHSLVIFMLANAWGLFLTELIESAMYLYRATRDPTLLELGRDAVESIEKISKVDCGFATVSAKSTAKSAKQPWREKKQRLESVPMNDILPLSQVITWVEFFFKPALCISL